MFRQQTYLLSEVHVGVSEGLHDSVDLVDPTQTWFFVSCYNNTAELRRGFISDFPTITASRTVIFLFTTNKSLTCAAVT